MKRKICFVCEGFGSHASDEPYMQMQTEKCSHCGGTGRLDQPSGSIPRDDTIETDSTSVSKSGTSQTGT